MPSFSGLRSMLYSFFSSKIVFFSISIACSQAAPERFFSGLLPFFLISKLARYKKFWPMKLPLLNNKKFRSMDQKKPDRPQFFLFPRPSFMRQFLRYCSSTKRRQKGQRLDFEPLLGRSAENSKSVLSAVSVQLLLPF